MRVHYLMRAIDFWCTFSNENRNFMCAYTMLGPALPIIKKGRRFLFVFIENISFSNRC